MQTTVPRYHYSISQYLYASKGDARKDDNIDFSNEFPADDSRYEFPLAMGSPYDAGSSVY